MKSYRQLVQEADIVDFKKARDAKSQAIHQKAVDDHNDKVAQASDPGFSLASTNAAIDHHEAEIHAHALSKTEPFPFKDEFTKAYFEKNHPGKHPVIAMAQHRNEPHMAKVIDRHRDVLVGHVKSALDACKDWDFNVAKSWKSGGGQKAEALKKTQGQLFHLRNSLKF